MEEKKTTTKPKLPIQKFRAGGVSATIWENTNQKNEVFHTVNIERSYKDKNDEWKTTSAFRISDLPRVSMVSYKAYEWILLKEGVKNNNETEEESTSATEETIKGE